MLEVFVYSAEDHCELGKIEFSNTNIESLADIIRNYIHQWCQCLPDITYTDFENDFVTLNTLSSYKVFEIVMVSMRKKKAINR